MTSCIYSEYLLTEWSRNTCKHLAITLAFVKLFCTHLFKNHFIPTLSVTMLRKHWNTLIHPNLPRSFPFLALKVPFPQKLFSPKLIVGIVGHPHWEINEEKKQIWLLPMNLTAQWRREKLINNHTEKLHNSITAMIPES